MRTRRKAYVGDRGALLASDWARLAEHALPHLSGYNLIASYCAMGSEIGARPLEHHLVSLAIDLALPCIADDWEQPLGFARFLPGDPLVTEVRSGIPQPLLSAERVVPQVVLVPLLAVDRRGLRLGQGAGHYDRTLRKLREFGQVFAVGLAYDSQIIDHVPDDPWDEPLNALATPTRWIDFI